MPERGWRAKLLEALRRGRGDPRRRDIGLYAANGAYYLFLSLGPLAALLLSVLPYTPVSEQAVLEGALAYAPAAFRQIVRAVAADVYAGSAAALGLSAALELWSGGRFLASVVRGAAALCGARRGYLRARLLGAAFTGALILFLVGDITLLRFGGRLLSAVELRRPALTGLWRWLLRLRPVILLGGLTAGNVLLFRYGAGAGGRLMGLTPGAALAAGAWLVFSRLYSWAMERFGLFGVYGSIAAAAASLYWMYGSLYILFWGAWINTLFLWERKD